MCSLLYENLRSKAWSTHKAQAKWWGKPCCNERQLSRAYISYLSKYWYRQGKAHRGPSLDLTIKAGILTSETLGLKLFTKLSTLPWSRHLESRLQSLDQESLVWVQHGSYKGEHWSQSLQVLPAFVLFSYKFHAFICFHPSFLLLFTSLFHT